MEQQQPITIELFELDLNSESVYINDLAHEIHQANVRKGFYDGVREQDANMGERLMLITSELAEALEAHRKGRRFTDLTEEESIDANKSIDNLIGLPPAELQERALAEFKKYFEDSVKDTFEDEIADAIIRLFDLAGFINMDLAFHLTTKLQYNSLRPYKHGKKY